MSTIGDLLKFKKRSWKEIDTVEFPAEIIEGCESCKVVQGDWQKRVCLTMKNGTFTHISIDTVSLERYPDMFELGNDVPLEDCKLIVLEYQGDPNPNLKVTKTTKLRYTPKGAKEVELDLEDSNPRTIFAGLLG